MLNAFIEIGLSKVSPEQPVFVNYTAGLLALDPIGTPDRCVIEILEDVPVNAESVRKVERLKRLGYRIALDDFVYSSDKVPFLRLANYVKLDLRALSDAEFAEHIKLLRSFPLKLLAEKIESEEEFRKCRALGCELFQGYYLRKPELVQGRRVPANRLSALSLLAECMEPDQPAAAIAAIVARDAALVYGLLRMANSALHGRKEKIQSSTQAVAWLGVDRVFRWASLLVLSRYDDCPLGYLGFALQRARACETLAKANGHPSTQAYMVGLLSTLDSILNAPLADIIGPLPLDVQFKRAILQRTGGLGQLLNAVLGYESGNLEAVARNGIPIQQVQHAFWEAVEYSAAMMNDLKVATAHSGAKRL